MSHGKVIGGNGTPEWQNGEFHQINLGVTGQRVVYEPHSEDRFKYETDLRRGNPVIAPNYVETINRTVSQDVLPDKVIDRARSAHGVSFGRLIGRRMSRNRRDGNIANIAIKPFRGEDKAMQEMEGYLVLQALGVETFDPIGVFPTAQHGNYVVVTKKRDDLQSLDREEWIVGRQPADEREVEVAERNARTVVEIAETMAWLHANGVIHPDGQIKNWAVNSAGTIGAIDTENLRVGVVDTIDLINMAWGDIEKLTRSLIANNKADLSGEDSADPNGDKIFGVGMLARLPLHQVRENLEQLIIAPYIRSLEGFLELNPTPDVADRVTELALGILTKFESEQTFPDFMIEAGALV